MSTNLSKGSFKSMHFYLVQKSREVWQPYWFTSEISWIISHLGFQGSGGLKWKENWEQLLSIWDRSHYVHSLLEMSPSKAAISTRLKTHGSSPLRAGIHYWKNNKGKFLFSSLSLCCWESCFLEKSQGLEGIWIMSGNKGQNGGGRAHFQKSFHTKHDGPGQLKVSRPVLDVIISIGPGLPLTHYPSSELLVLIAEGERTQS